MPGHVFEGAVCMQVSLCQCTHMGVGDQESVVEQGLRSASWGGGAQVLGVGLAHKSYP